MAKRPVKVSGYVRMRRKGKSVITTIVRGYERARPSASTVAAEYVPIAGRWEGAGDGARQLVIDAPAPGSYRVDAPGEDCPWYAVTQYPGRMVVTIQERPAPERRTVEGTVRNGPFASTVYDDAAPYGPERWPLVRAFEAIGEGRRVRVTIEVLDDPANTR